MYKWILGLLVCGWLGSAHAENCNKYREDYSHLENLRLTGGSSKKMARWQRQMQELESKLLLCQRAMGIQIASGESVAAVSRPEKLRTSSNRHPQLQQLISTCNYWITEHNHHPTEDNRNLKNAACKAVDDWERVRPTTTTAKRQSQRTLQDCIKPDNLIDEDVAQCIQGSRTPSWNNPEG